MLNNLAELYRIQGRYREAEPLYKQALEIRRESTDRDEPAMAATLNNLGLLYFHLGQYDQSERLLRQALTIRERVLGRTIPMLPPA